MTKEHVWPAWARELISAEEAQATRTHAFRDGKLGLVRKFEQRLFNQTVRDVCATCNNGWMSNLEGRVKDLAEGMLVGRRRMLHPSQQAMLAQWAHLKVLVCQRGFPRNSIPAEQYREMYSGRDQFKPATTITVGTARSAWSAGGAPPLYYRINGLMPTGGDPGTTVDFGYLATFSVLDLVVQVFWLRDGTREKWLSDTISDQVRIIWPPGRRFAWPGGAALTTAGLAAISGELDVAQRQSAA